ncbi:MAG: hypothetical protein FJ135_10915 [Deltaproteobacteria bacterium]|nr:hypothetical protein [Deltaproteobacteria bacterium]
MSLYQKMLLHIFNLSKIFYQGAACSRGITGNGAQFTIAPGTSGISGLSYGFCGKLSVARQVFNKKDLDAGSIAAYYKH